MTTRERHLAVLAFLAAVAAVYGLSLVGGRAAG